jgi:K(+)-stimulated pyrophosphate-energized sodium pump
LELFLWAAPIAGVLALLFALYLATYVGKQEDGSERMREIGSAIREGAMAFLTREYRALAVFVVALFIVLSIFINWKTAICYIVGSSASVLAGFFGMRVATKANVRTAQAARQGQAKALSIAFSGGAVMGMSVVGLGALGIGILYLFFRDVSIVNGFALGASSIALFARVGGGIYTKAADVGADLVGKVEAGIPEDDPRNPAVIADNVGDNVGDVAGMGADLFESYVGSIVATMALAVTLANVNTLNAILLPLLLAAVGIVASIIGSRFVRGGEGSAQRALTMGTYVAGGLTLAAGFGIVYLLRLPVGIFYAIAAGLVAGVAIGQITEYYTSGDYTPVKDIAASSTTGPATVVISGLATGMLSTVWPIVVIGAAILVAYTYGGMYGIAVSAVGMLSTTGMTVAVDAYGPIADNAGGIAEMSDLPKDVRKVTDGLDAVGNTTAAIGKGFAIGSAALTALSLFAAYSGAVGLTSINILDPAVMIGLLLGGMMPYLFSALAMRSVGQAAQHMIAEVRRQFREIAGLMEGKARPDYAKCVDISTVAALKQMVLPGLLAVLVPLAVGFILGKGALGGLLAGSVVTGVLVAVQMANSGGAWDNAKKYIEEGNYGGKGTAAHSAAVVGDTIGDPFKDTAGPSLNILIKLMSIVALVFAPLFL